MATKKTVKVVKNKNSNSIYKIDDKLIKEYADIFSNHDLKLLEIDSNGTKIVLKKSEPTTTTQVIASTPAIEQTVYSPVPTAVAPEKEPVVENKTEAASSNYKEILSPIVGTFYESSSPDSPPYVKEGDVVREDTVVCIVEAMKMMNEIKAGINGKIIRRLVDNNSAVESGTVLFLVE